MEEEEYYNNNMPPYQSENNNLPPEGGDMPEDEKFFKDLTNEDIDMRDPSLGKDLLKIYEEEVPFEIREDKEELSSENGIFESLLCKIFVCEDINQQSKVKFEIGCDKDLFFYYFCEVSPELFESLKENQKLTCNFDNFSDLVIQFFDNCISDTKKFLAVFTLKNDGKAKMELFENLEHKFAELIALDFSPASDDIIRQQITFRYNAMRATDDIAQNRIDIINGVLKDLDPQLIHEVKKDVSTVKVNNYLRDKPIIQKH